MKILLANLVMDQVSGTVSYIAELAVALKTRGHTVEVFTYRKGEASSGLEEQGIRVVSHLDHLRENPQIVHSHHNPITFDVIRKFGDVPVIYFLHDSESIYDYPPWSRNILKYVADDYLCLDRLDRETGLQDGKNMVLYNWVNTQRFKLRDQFAEKPRSALVFSNYAREDNYYQAIRKACQRAQINLDVIGLGMGTYTPDPESKLMNYDIVFAKGKAAMEAMATGAALIPCDFDGLGEMVNAENFEEFRRYNFGRKILARPIGSELIIEEIKKYRKEQAQETALRIRREAAFEGVVDQLIHLYETTLQEYSQGKRGPLRKNLFSTFRSRLLKVYFFRTRFFFYEFARKFFRILKK